MKTKNIVTASLQSTLTTGKKAIKFFLLNSSFLILTFFLLPISILKPAICYAETNPSSDTGNKEDARDKAIQHRAETKYKDDPDALQKATDDYNQDPKEVLKEWIDSVPDSASEKDSADRLAAAKEVAGPNGAPGFDGPGSDTPPQDLDNQNQNTSSNNPNTRATLRNDGKNDGMSQFDAQKASSIPSQKAIEQALNSDKVLKTGADLTAARSVAVGAGLGFGTRTALGDYTSYGAECSTGAAKMASTYQEALYGKGANFGSGELNQGVSPNSGWVVSATGTYADLASQGLIKAGNLVTSPINTEECGAHAEFYGAGSTVYSAGLQPQGSIFGGNQTVTVYTCVGAPKK